MVKFASSWGLLDTIWRQASANPFYQVFCPSTFLSVHPSIWYIFAQKVIEVWKSANFRCPTKSPWSAKFSIQSPKTHTKQCSVRCLSAFCPQLLNGLFRTHFIYYFGDFPSKELNHIQPFYFGIYFQVHPFMFFLFFSHLQHLQKVPRPWSWPSWELL